MFVFLVKHNNVEWGGVGGRGDSVSDNHCVSHTSVGLFL